jgi:HD-GYP domain-containing protein (c-di-GMP phosphodiesterase class II)
MTMSIRTTAKQMESLGFGDSQEERKFFKKSRNGTWQAPQAVDITRVRQMESMGFGDSLDERIFFTGPPSTREPTRLARLEARKAAAGILRTFVTRGPEDEAHCERVASWSRRLAKDLGLSAERVLDVELGALLHDVGYVALRGVAFATKGPLTHSDWFELRRHPALGAALLNEIPVLRRGMPLVATHHEHFDGTGYPRGLRGDEIPIDARIFHLVDAYDALTNDRPHRAACSDAAAREEIANSVGSHFDPVVHAAFAKIDPEEWRSLVTGIQ